MNAYPQPIYDAGLVSPYTGITCRVWLDDGSEHIATMYEGRWMCTREERDVHPVRWQRLVPNYGTGFPGLLRCRFPVPFRSGLIEPASALNPPENERGPIS